MTNSTNPEPIPPDHRRELEARADAFLNTHRNLDSFLDQKGIKPRGEFRFFLCLGKGNYGPQSKGILPKEIASQLKVAPGQVTRWIGKYEEGGLISVTNPYRTRDLDRRTKPIRLTEEGERLYEGLLRVFEKYHSAE